MSYIVYQVISWPLAVVADLQSANQNAKYAAAIGIAAPIFVLGLPDANMEIVDLAVWYLKAGAMFTVAQNLLVPAPGIKQY